MPRFDQLCTLGSWTAGSSDGGGHEQDAGRGLPRAGVPLRCWLAVRRFAVDQRLLLLTLQRPRLFICRSKISGAKNESVEPRSEINARRGPSSSSPLVCGPTVAVAERAGFGGAGGPNATDKHTRSRQLRQIGLLKGSGMRHPRSAVLAGIYHRQARHRPENDLSPSCAAWLSADKHRLSGP